LPYIKFLQIIELCWSDFGGSYAADQGLFFSSMRERYEQEKDVLLKNGSPFVNFLLTPVGGAVPDFHGEKSLTAA
jgi:hypothetical protein